MNERIVVQLASIPSRIESLKQTIDSLYPQVNGIFVALNGYEEVPTFLRWDTKIMCVTLDNKYADCAKFYRVEERNGFILTCDDDLVYPKTYAQDMIDAIKKHKCIVTLHGKRYPSPFIDFYHIERNYRCLGNTPEGGFVHVGGTGVMGWHSDFLKVKFDDFKSPNMADIWMAKVAHEQNVKMWVMPHTENYLKHTKFPNSLFEQEHKKGFKEQTAILKEMFA